MGCLTERYREELAAELPEVDFMFGVAELGQILDKLAGEELTINPPAHIPDPDHPPRMISTARHWAYLKIADGCSNSCAFCIIPKIRGGYRSRPLAEVVAEANQLADRGVTEIILVAQDTTLYGADLHMKNGLATLLEALVKIDTLRWVRLLYLYPALITDRLLAVIAAQPKVVPYFDIPLQHGSDAVLARMGRPETNVSIRSLIANIRAAVPNAAIRTGVIVGFPGETEEDYETLLTLIRDMEFDHLGAFIYSPEEGTTAFEMENDVDPETAAQRYNSVMETQRQIVAAKNNAMIGTTIAVVVDPLDPDEGENIVTARTARMAPGIDGVVILDEVDAVEGEMVMVTITGVADYDLVGRPASA
jgi:ribosomal protein S12 methylthiotransferase